MTKQILALALLMVGSIAQADSLVEDLNAQYGEENIAVLELGGRAVVCGYSDVNSDVNQAHYADNVCRHFGYAEAVGHRCGWEAGRDTNFPPITLSVDPVFGRPIAIPFRKEPGRGLGFYSTVICLLKPLKR
ncbi:MAG: hypothetical protein IPK68_08200 [Bdellovibrionales bacterium]|nr:hypothetical protein [Bdellovibrionales bacterium]